MITKPKVMTSQEKVIWKATYNFAKSTLNLNEEQSIAEADKKVESIRKLKTIKGIIRK